MSDDRTRRLRRERQRVERRRDAGERDAYEARRLQANAALRRELRHNSRRHVIAYVMWAVAGIMAIGHFFEHLGTFTIVSSGFEDLVLGWPMAMLIAVAGVFVYGR